MALATNTKETCEDQISGPIFCGDTMSAELDLREIVRAECGGHIQIWQIVRCARELLQTPLCRFCSIRICPRNRHYDAHLFSLYHKAYIREARILIEEEEPPTERACMSSEYENSYEDPLGW